MLFFLLSLVALMTLLSVFKREVTFIKARSEGAGGGAAPGDKHRQLDKQAVEEALRRQFDREASLVFVPGEEWAGSIEGSGGKSGHKQGAGEKKAKDARAEVTGKNDGKPTGGSREDVVDVDVDGDGDGEDVYEADDYVRDGEVDPSEKKMVDVEDYRDDFDLSEEIDGASDDTSSEDYGVTPDEDDTSASSTQATKATKTSRTSFEVQQGLQELKACTTLECIGKVHKKLAGKTKFNAPHYFLIGFQKCATTSVNNYLRGHPAYMPSVLKEAHYFTACSKSWNDTNCKANSTQDYIDNYLRISDAVDNGLMAATVDASVDYAWKGEDLAREIYSVFPWLKIVVMMREPISRVISYTRMWTQKGVRTSTHKDNRIACDANEDLFECLYPHLTPTAYTGHYATPLEGWLKVWPADQIHVIQFEEFVSETDAVMRRLKKFLGLDPTLPENQQLYNVNTRKDSGGSPMKRREYRTLIEMARPDSERVADLLQKHGLAEKDAWMRRWEGVWEENLKACGPDRVCLINSN